MPWRKCALQINKHIAYVHTQPRQRHKHTHDFEYFEYSQSLLASYDFRARRLRMKSNIYCICFYDFRAQSLRMKSNIYCFCFYDAKRHLQITLSVRSSACHDRISEMTFSSLIAFRSTGHLLTYYLRFRKLYNCLEWFFLSVRSFSLSLPRQCLPHATSSLRRRPPNPSLFFKNSPSTRQRVSIWHIRTGCKGLLPPPPPPSNLSTLWPSNLSIHWSSYLFTLQPLNFPPSNLPTFPSSDLHTFLPFDLPLTPTSARRAKIV